MGMLDGRIGIVTGAGRGAASEVVEEITGSGGKAVANFDDVADWEGAQRMINQAVETYGRLDALVCNAGFVRDRTVFNMTEDEWDDVVRVHLKGHFVPTRWAPAYGRERFKESNQPVGGRIVYTASEAGLYGNAGQPNYSAAKAGIAAQIGRASCRERV